MDLTVNEQSPAAGWQYLSKLPSVGADPGANATSGYYWNPGDGSFVGSQGTLVGLQVVGGLVPSMPPIYSAPITSDGQDYNIDSGSNGVIRTMHVQYAPNSTFATTQSVPVALALNSVPIINGWWWTIDRNPIIEIKQLQPYASVYCQPNPILGEGDSRDFQFPTDYIAGCASPDGADCDISNNLSTTDYSGLNRGQIFSQWNSNPKGQVIWINNITISHPSTTSSLGTIVIQPDLCQNQYLMSSACIVGAQWANTTSRLQDPTNYGPSSANAIAYGSKDYGTGNSIITADDLAFTPKWSQPSISLSVAWATSLDQLTDLENRTVSDNLLRLMLITDNVCPTNGTYAARDHERPYMHERLLATMVVNGLAHAGSTSPFCFNAPSSSGWQCPSSEGETTGPTLPAFPPPGVLLTMQGYLPGYAWNHDGVPIKISLVIPIIYCVYVGAYVIYTLVSGRSSMTWRNLSDLTALALNSRPTGVLKHNSCGIDRTATFRNLVGVREVEGAGDTSGLELIFIDKRRKDGERELRDRASALVGRAY